jgi:D-beta-D-heptose 7-phosphate kinase/D-beta-D-heptose 1-phosphate adenosyltransferase
VLVKGADYARKDIVGADEVEGWGGRVVRVPLVDGKSTSDLVHKLRRT